MHDSSAAFALQPPLPALCPPLPFSLAGLPQAVLMCGLAVVERLAKAPSPRGALWICVANVSRCFFCSPSLLPISLSHTGLAVSLTLFPSDVFWAEKSKFQHAQIVWHFITWNVDAEAVEMIEIE